MNVFFGNDGGSTIKKHLNFESEQSKKLDISQCSNSANSAVTSWSCSKKLCQEVNNAGIESCGGVSALGSFPERFSLAETDDLNGSVKRMKFSAAEVSWGKAERRTILNAPLRQNTIITGLSSTPMDSICQTVMVPLVESSAKGVTSSCCLLKRHVGKGRGKATASPVLQESFASKLVVSSPATGMEKFESPLYAEEKLSGFQSSGAEGCIFLGHWALRRILVLFFSDLFFTY
ncbi:increased DNA methylation 1-like isoform X2 [Hibiscus syriacus]|nr:increased DNA methylation 1-like isoform X2 [Hibiscus syriacus]